LGHNHFFKNNYLFKERTDASAILDYLEFAKTYVARCEERYGLETVEAVLDSAHALMNQGVSRNPAGRKARSLEREREREMARRQHEEQSFNDLWRTLPTSNRREGAANPSIQGGKESESLGLPEENLLYFLEKHAPKLEGWQRELLRIVRMLAQYFYPQRQTKMMNEGCATYVHYRILNRLYEQGRLSEGSMLEFLHSHSSVVFQPAWSDRFFSGLNPYALGFAIMRDVQRICEEPTSEDCDWFPEIAGNGDPMATLRQLWAEYRDDSCIMQFLSPKVIRDFRMFEVRDVSGAPVAEVKAIHNEEGYRRVRRQLSMHYDVSAQDPDLQVIDADLSGARRLMIQHKVRSGVLLDKDSCDRTLLHLARLWGYRVKLIEVDADSGKTLREHEALPMP
jgi:spore cortex formation protein SpoVR/YcgB (stage V sporulation)